jgi:chromosome segregation ATPase
MKARGQIMVGNGFDGFDKNVAEKMPKMRKEEEVSPAAPVSEEALPIHEASQGIEPAEKAAEKKAALIPQPDEGPGEENLEVLKLIEDLHGQLLISNRTKRALEIDLVSSQKMFQQLAQENKALGIQIESLKKELHKSEEIQSELAYLEEENEDALERITALQGELKGLRETLVKTTQERDQAFAQIQILEAKIEQNDLLRIKGKLKEREASQFSEENEDLRRRLELALTQNVDLEKRYGVLKKSFNEVKESLTLLRDACKTSYYNPSDSPES